MASTVQLVALKRIPYGKRSIQLDETFEASARDADLLVRAGIAKRADAGAHPEQPIVEPPRPEHPIVEPAPEPTPLPATAEPTAEDEAPPTGEAEPMTTKNITKRGTYKRRDLTAEGDE